MKWVLTVMTLIVVLIWVVALDGGMSRVPACMPECTPVVMKGP
jgi:hypothetical protein